MSILKKKKKMSLKMRVTLKDKFRSLIFASKNNENAFVCLDDLTQVGLVLVVFGYHRIASQQIYHFT